LDDCDDDLVLVEAAIRTAAIPFDLRQFNNIRDATDYLKGEGIFADRTDHPFPTVFLLDYKLNGTTACQCLPAIRSLPRCRDLIVVILTGSDYHSHIRRSYKSGADHLFTKPVSCSELTLILKELHYCATLSPACYATLQALQHYRFHYETGSEGPSASAA